MFPEPSIVRANGIDLAVYEQGQGPAVVLLHGFPELAYSWRHQLPALADAGFRAVAPDQRGYGGSDVPPDVSDYRIEELIADRNAARKSKNWAEADRCRDELTGMGVLIEDTANGTEWKLK